MAIDSPQIRSFRNDHELAPFVGRNTFRELLQPSLFATDRASPAVVIHPDDRVVAVTVPAGTRNCARTFLPEGCCGVSGPESLPLAVCISYMKPRVLTRTRRVRA
jgi:hypothetical protein